MKRLLILGLFLGLFSCNDDGNEVSPASSRIDAVTEQNIIGGGGEFAIGYTIDNPVSGETLTASVDADWVEILSVDNSIVRLNAKPNSKKENRTANLTLKYKGAADHVVALTQVVRDIDFSLSVDAVGAYGCTITYSPIKYSGHYIFFVVEKDTLDPYLASAENLEAWYAADLAYIKKLAEQNNVTLGELIVRAPQIFGTYGQEVTMSYSTLDINTDYYAYCYGLDTEGNRMTDMAYVAFKTGVVEGVDMTFSALVKDVTENTAYVEVTPSNNKDTYYWTYISDFDFVSKAGSDVNNVMSIMISSLKATGELASSLHRGVSYQSIDDLWDNTLYRVVAWGMDDKGTPTTEAFEVTQFTTPAKGVTDKCTFDVTVTDVKDMDIRVKIVPSNLETRYYVALIEEGKCAGYSDDQMAQRIINMENARFETGFYGEGVNWSNFDSMLTGEQEVWGRADLYWTFVPEHTYRIFVFGIDGQGNRTTDVKRIDQKTLPTDRSNMTIKIDYLADQSTWKKCMFRFTPSNDDEYYLPYLAYKSDIDTYYRNPDGSLNTAEIMEEIEHAFDGETNYYLRKGTREVEFNWSAGVEYTMLVCGYAGTNTTDFFEYTVTAPEIPFDKSDADLEATYELFDGAELYKLAPGRWADYKENCIIRITYKPNDKAVHWYGGVWMPVETYERDGGISYLMMLLQNPGVSHVDRKTGMYLGLAFQTTVSLSYVAEGADGTYGPWHYEEITPYRDGVLKNTTEAYDFWSNPSPNSQILALPKR